MDSRPRTSTTPVVRTRRSPQARVALALLEALRDLDRPGEILDDENVTLTLPRRLGLSGVVDAQIRRYQQEARHGRRVPESEVRDLIRLVTRRPDAEELFHQVGRSLTAANGAPAWRAVLPRRVVVQMARRRIRRRLRALFGGRMVSVGRGPFRIDAASSLLLDVDPDGAACALVTGLAQAVMEAYGGVSRPVVVHATCMARGDGTCSWTLEERPVDQEGGRHVSSGANGESDGTNGEADGANGELDGANGRKDREGGD
jgi:hypothetical protein